MPISRDYDLREFFSKPEIDGDEEVDFLSSSPLDFEFETVNRKFRVKSQHVGRPDLISLEAYNSVVYWWIILLANDIDDPFNGIEEGDVLILPKPSEVFDFLEKFRKDG